MKLALQFIDHNPYPRCGIFIKHASPKVWLQEIQRMQIRLSDCKAYVCPSLEANGISGVLVILKTPQKNIDIGNNSTIQKVYDKFFIPEHTTLNMALTDEEFTKLCNGIPHFFHHEFGLIELKEVLDWTTIIQNPQEQFPTIETPIKGVNIPTKVTAFSIEIEEEEEVEALNNPFGTEEVDPKDLPFDMKKVLEGNNVEVEKYLNYLDKNPDAALKMALPLDMMGTSRGKAFAKYKFKNSFFESLGFGNINESGKKYIKTIVTILAIVLVCWIGYKTLYPEKNNTNTDPEISNSYEETNQTNNTETSSVNEDGEEDDAGLDTGKTGQYQEGEINAENNIGQNVLLFIAVLALLFLIRYLIQYRKRKALQNKLQTNQSWLDLPDESELFTIHEEENRKKENNSTFYFGGNEISFQNKIFISIILIGLLVYLFYPVLGNEGFPISFGVIAGFVVLRMLYTLIIKNQVFDEDDA